MNTSFRNACSRRVDWTCKKNQSNAKVIDIDFLKQPGQYAWLFLWVFVLGVASCSSGNTPITANNFENLGLNAFVEPEFPFFSTYLDARDLGQGFPGDNVVARGLALQLGPSAYACFDTDLLRWSVAWTGQQLPMVLMPQISYHDFFDNKNDIPRIKGTPEIANGMYPGWTVNGLKHREVRLDRQRREGFHWGALPVEYGRWRGVYTHGKRALLSYLVGTTPVKELPGFTTAGFGPVFTRTFEIDASSDTLYLNAVAVGNGFGGTTAGNLGYIFQGAAEDTVTAVMANGGNGSCYMVHAVDDRYLSVEVLPSEQKRQVTVYTWRGAASAVDSLRHLAEEGHEENLLPFLQGGPPHWAGAVYTKGQCSPDTAAFVVDVLTLPLPNPWNRNVRVMDIAFLTATKAAVVTFEGDVWLVEGISKGLKALEWTRFASGLYEPMSIETRDGEIYVFGKEGIVRLHDLNGDGAADFYENFSNAMDQSTESREYAGDMVAASDGSFFISKGGANAGGPGITPKVEQSFRAGSNHSGTIIRVSADGLRADVFATGLRMPYLGIRPTDDRLSATDQQGHFVPSTPVYFVEPGDYFGVSPNKHSEEEITVKQPLTWIPHRIDRSAGSELWVSGDKMGPLNNALLHFSFGRPGMFKVLIDSTLSGLQGGVVFIDANYKAPTIKGTISPSDGQLYIAGMNLFGSNSQGISAIQRLRYTGKPSYILSGFEAGKQGIILSFDCELDEVAVTDNANYQVKRWNYKRTEQYGSGHYKYDRTSGEEGLPVLAAYLSGDKKQVLLLVPDMKEIDQMEVMYNVKASDGQDMADGLWFSVHHADDLHTDKQGFGEVDFEKLKLTPDQIVAMIKSDLPVTVDRGRELFVRTGCAGCHSTGLKTDGMYGPPFQGLYGSKRELVDGTIITVDDAYLKESMLQPMKKVVKGYNAEMPSYEGVLSESDLQSIIFYIKTLYR